MLESRIPKELHRRIFELTLALYRVTDFFPPGEILRKHLREKANEVFGNITEYGYTNRGEQEAISVIAKIQALKGHLGIARSMRFVKSINLTVLEREYEYLADFFIRELESVKYHPREESKKQPEVKKKQPEREGLSTWHDFSSASKEPKEAKHPPTIIKDAGLSKIDRDINERQKAILEHLKQNSQAKISDFFPVFSGVSSKTIQRDLQDLVIKNMLKKEGEKRWTTYYINDVL